MAAGRCAEKGQTVNEASIKIGADWKYFRVEITDTEGQKAFSNAHFLEDLEYFKK